MKTAAIETSWHSYPTEAEWIAAARAWMPQGGSIVTPHGSKPDAPVMAVQDRNGRLVARVGWKKPK